MVGGAITLALLEKRLQMAWNCDGAPERAGESAPRGRTLETDEPRAGVGAPTRRSSGRIVRQFAPHRDEA
jgi:hypothetical protein